MREVSVQVARAPVGSTEIAALKASNESPSEFRGSVRGNAEFKLKQWILIEETAMVSLLL